MPVIGVPTDTAPDGLAPVTVPEKLQVATCAFAAIGPDTRAASNNNALMFLFI